MASRGFRTSPGRRGDERSRSVAGRREDAGKGGASLQDFSSTPRMSARNLNMLPKSVISSLKQIDYTPWQREQVIQKPKLRLFFSAAVSSKQKKEQNKKSLAKLKEEGRGPSTALQALPSLRPKRGWQRGLTKEMVKMRSLENIKILQRLCKSKKASLEELKHHSKVLLDKNRELLKLIQQMDADSTRQTRSVLQQYNMFGTVIAALQDSNQNQVGRSKADLEATEKLVEKNTGKLDQEMKSMSAKVHTLQEELNVLRTYMDKEFPLKNVQIASLKRSIRKLREEEQYDLEDTEDLARRFLETLAEKTREEEEYILQGVVDKTLLEYQDGLDQMYRNNRELTRQIETRKRMIGELVEEIRGLHKSIIKLQHSAGDPRKVVFADVLLCRPRCTPDMDVILNIPTEEMFLL